jgi:tagatose 6-phosphate kinase
MILTIGTTPAVQRVMLFSNLKINEVNRASATYETSAGKAVNVAKALAALGSSHKTVCAGFLGGGRGTFVKAHLQSLAVGDAWVESSASTRLCTTIIDQEANTQTELVEESGPAKPEELSRLLEKLRELMGSARAVVLAGSLAPGVPPTFYRECLELAGASTVLSIVDAQGEPLTHALEAGPSIVKINRMELMKSTQAEIEGNWTVRRGVETLQRKGAKAVIVTAGSQPVLCSDGKKVTEILPPRIEALNPIGSGDSFSAGLLNALLRGADLFEAARFGVACGVANALTLLPAEFEKRQVDELVTQVRMVAA